MAHKVWDIYSIKLFVDTIPFDSCIVHRAQKNSANSIDCIMFKTEISTWFGFTATEKNQTNESKVLRYLIQFFIFILFVPNVSFCGISCLVLSFWLFFFISYRKGDNLFSSLIVKQIVKFYRSAAIDFDIDTALESMIFVSTHFIINTQFNCSLWNASILRQMSASLIEEMNQGLEQEKLQFFTVAASNFLAETVQYISQI